MERKDNYLIQANQAKQHFLTYDQQMLIRKLKVSADESYIYVTFLQEPYRINRKTGDIERRVSDSWVDGNSYEEVMTLLDLVCDSREDRWRTCRWRSMIRIWWKRNGVVWRTCLIGIRRGCVGPVKRYMVGQFRERISAMPLNFLTGWRSVFSSGTEMTNSIPDSGICGMKMP